MAWAKNTFSRSQIDAAGDVLRAGRRKTNFLEYINAYDVMNTWRTSHAFPLNTMQMSLRNRAWSIDPGAEVVQRMKRAPSIIQKLRYNPKMLLSRMQDLGGCRAIVSDVSQISEIRKLYGSSRDRHILASEKDYVNSPRDSGYRSHHLIYRYQSDRNNEYDNHRIEIQIRSRVQHAWATAVEIAGTFVDSPLKSSIGPSDWLEFFKLASSAFSILEGTPRLHSTLDQQSVISELASLDLRLNARAQLKNFSVAHSVIQQTKRKQHTHFLLKLNVEANTLEIQPFSNVFLATEAYATVEKAAVEDSNLDIVLVAANSIESVGKAYPNYFADTSIFLDMLSSYLD